jgi:hypothetical protein
MRAEHAGASGRADPGDLYTAQPRERHRPANAGSAISNVSPAVGIARSPGGL